MFCQVAAFVTFRDKGGGQDGEEVNGGRERGEDGQTKCVEEEMRDEQMEGGAARVC